MFYKRLLTLTNNQEEKKTIGNVEEAYLKNMPNVFFFFT